MADRIVLISDVHMDEWAGDIGDDAAREKRARLLEFFDWVLDQARPAQLCIAGDLVDIPQADGRPLLPRYQDVLEKLTAVVTAGIKLRYVIGNHDSGMVGVSVDVASPVATVQVHYPYITLVSGGHNILVEHGHLHDSFLFLYVKTLMEQTLASGAVPASVVGRAMVAAAAPGWGPPELATSLNQLWQVPRAARTLAADQAWACLEALRADLSDEYSDVTDAQDAEMLAARAEVVDEWDRVLEGVSTQGFMGPMNRGQPWYDQAIQRYYYGPRWRRAALKRAQDVSAHTGLRIHGVVTGHTHCPDEKELHTPDGTVHYVNSGTWRWERADIVVIEDGQLQLYRRSWKDPYPALP